MVIRVSELVFADRLAEAFAEYLHKHARDEWGYGQHEHLSPEDRAQVRAQLEALLPKNISKVVSYGAEQQGYIKNPKAEQMVKELNKKVGILEYKISKLTGE